MESTKALARDIFYGNNGAKPLQPSCRKSRPPGRLDRRKEEHCLHNRSWREPNDNGNDGEYWNRTPDSEYMWPV